MKYFASCSFGKDSIATVLLALEHKEPLDGILFTEVMFDRLDDEATPYALRVGKGENHLKAITIYCDGKDVDYFTNILNNEI